MPSRVALEGKVALASEVQVRPAPKPNLRAFPINTSATFLLTMSV
jgi:hypothetical protein